MSGRPAGRSDGFTSALTPTGECPHRSPGAENPYEGRFV
jgi:hypothetical protein